ncbi:unnamed protein product, partial [marine sediment metagenome]
TYVSISHDLCLERAREAMQKDIKDKGIIHFISYTNKPGALIWRQSEYLNTLAIYSHFLQKGIQLLNPILSPDIARKVATSFLVTA